MFIEVIPFGGSIDDEGLTYFARDELAPQIQIGCLVEVPFRNAIDYAIVTGVEDLVSPHPNYPRSTAYGEPLLEGEGVKKESIYPSPSRGRDGEGVENIRSIVRVITSIPLLAPYQIRSIFDTASYYLVHTHHILSLFLSKTLVKYLEKQDFRAHNSTPSISRRCPGGEVEEVNNTIQFYHHTSDTSFFESIHKHVNLPSPSGRGAGGEGTILVFPDDFSIEAYLKYCLIDLETTLVVPDSLTETKKHKAFFSVYNGEKNIIIWTRRILYYNLSRYDRIIYIEDSLHKTLMRFNHTYKHLEILRRMAPNSHLEITILSSLPSIESMYLLGTGIYKTMKK